MNAALSEIGAIAPGNDPATEDSTFVLGKLNRLLNAWAVRRLFCYVINQASYTFGTSQQSYTIGPSGADFTAPRPVKIEYANVIIVSSDPDLHIPLEVINTSDYASLAIPALSSDFPSKLYYQPTVTKGTLWPWPYPTNTSNKLELFSWLALTEISSVGSDYPLPPGYQDAIIYSLAESIAPAYGKQVSPDLRELARKARADIASINTAPPKLDCSLGSGGMINGYSRSRFLSGGFI